MDRPKSMSVKDYLYKTLAIKLNIPSKTIELVIQHEFEALSGAMKSNNSLEIAGFGKFLYNSKKAQKMLENNYKIMEILKKRLEDPNITELKKQSTLNKIETCNKYINSIKPKLNVE